MKRTIRWPARSCRSRWRCGKRVGKGQAATADAAFFSGEAKYAEGRYRESATAYQKALNLKPDDSTVMNNLALSLQNTGDYAGAEPLYRRALATAEKSPERDDIHVGAVSNNLALLLLAKGDYRGAGPCFEGL